MSELQDELDSAQSNDLYIPLPILDAARRVADPDAATQRILDRMGMHEHTQRDWDKAYELALAALGIDPPEET